MKICVLLLAASLGAVMVSGEDDHKTINEKQRSLLMDNFDTDFRPCTTFYNYACYKWSENHKAKRDNYTNVAEMLNYEVNLELMEYFEKTPESNMPGFVKMVKDFFVSCRETAELTILDFMHLLERQENMKWALFTADNSEDFVFDWTAIAARFRKYGFNYLFRSEAKKSPDADKFTMYFKMPNFSSFNYIFHFEMEEYNRTIPLPSGTMNFEELWEIIDTFEDKFREIKVPKETEPTMFKFHELPYPWMQSYLKALLHPQAIDPDMEVGVYNMAYMATLDNFLKPYDAIFLARYIELRFMQIFDKLNQRSYPSKCMTITKNIFPMATEYIYGQMHPELVEEVPKIKQIFENMVRSVNKSLHLDVSGVIPKAFFDKLETMHMKVGNLPQERDAKDLLESYYAQLKLTPSDYYLNNLEIMKFYFKFWQDSKYAVEDDMMFYQNKPNYDYEADIEPTYVASMNLFIYPLGLFRPPVYHADFEDIFKQSSLATLMAVRIFDAFLGVDDDGFPADDVKQIAGVIGLYSSFEAFFSTLTAEEISRYQTMFGFTTLQQLKEMFLLGSVHYKCEWIPASLQHYVDSTVSHLSAFTEVYDCKLNNYVKMF
ncbi:uncharacterized protein LOC101899681 [Musca domestica]|uniref:Uncharacterized protein LOC101899681 n=1 Tax=Musca domestica TaxID=7370 RepID=A0A1I8MDM1_MUSDO|nr:uncharacterized protein LOC101899681 [Musca domestica]